MILTQVQIESDQDGIVLKGIKLKSKIEFQTQAGYFHKALMISPNVNSHHLCVYKSAGEALTMPTLKC